MVYLSSRGCRSRWRFFNNQLLYTTMNLYSYTYHPIQISAILKRFLLDLKTHCAVHGLFALFCCSKTFYTLSSCHNPCAFLYQSDSVFLDIHIYRSMSSQGCLSSFRWSPENSCELCIIGTLSLISLPISDILILCHQFIPLLTALFPVAFNALHQQKLS